MSAGPEAGGGRVATSPRPAAVSAGAPRDRGEPPAVVPVPRSQQRVWIADQLTPEPAAYLGGVFLRLRGALDVAAMRRALAEIVARHEVLRTSIVERDGDLVGLLRPAAEFRLEVEAVEEAALDAAIRGVATAPMDVAEHLPMRARLLRLSSADHVLCVIMHHLAHDGASVGILYRELAYFYARFSGGAVTEPAPQAVPRQFREIAAEDEDRYDDRHLAPVLAERRAALGGRSPFEVPTDRPRPAARTGAGDLYRAAGLPTGTVDRLAALAGDRAATLFMVLLAGCHAVLYRYSGRGDVVTGTSSTTRRHDAAGNAVIGPFFNMVVVAGDVSGNPTFAELLDRVRDAAVNAYEARLLPFDTLVSELAVERDPAATPLFRILVDLVLPGDPPGLPGLRVEEILTAGAGSKYDLTLEFRRGADGLDLFVEWDTSLYDAATVQQLMAHLRAVLLAVAEDPGTRVDDIPMLDDAEVLALRSLAEPEPAEPPDGCLHDLVSAQAARTPDAVAVRDGTRQLTYAELDHLSTAVAEGLLGMGVTTGVPVGVLQDRSADLVATLLGILKAGGAYLPVDTELPPARAATLLAAAAAPVCLVPGDTEDTGIDVAAVRAAVAGAGCRVVGLDALLGPAGTGPGSHAGLPAVRPGDLCAVYFTSGSTGRPKGVACTHRGWVGQMRNMQLLYRLEPGEAVLLKTPLGFDDVAREVFWPLMVGAQVVVLPPGLHRDPQALIAATARHGVVWLQFVPSMLGLFLDCVEPRHVEGLAGLRHVVSDGDRLRPDVVATFLDRFAGTGSRLNNHWGTTEVAIDTTHHACDDADRHGTDAITVGRPMPYNSVYVLDRAFQPVPRGAVGELCIGGAGLARGYLGQPGATARAFVPHPWRPSERLYRTGDLGRLRPDGSLAYLGRRDHQVKVRGIRIELGEVESAIRAFPSVTDVVVDTWEAGPGDRRLVAYVTVSPGDDAGDTAGDAEASVRSRLRDFLVDRLPSSAVPGVITLLSRLPRMPSGKVDRRSLPAPAPGSPHDRPYVAPATETERALARMWAETLGIGRLGVHDDFFAAGGHSLLVTRVVNRMRSAFGIDVPIRLVFEHPTVRSAAADVQRLILEDIEAMSEADAERLLSAATGDPTGPSRDRG